MEGWSRHLQGHGVVENTSNHTSRYIPAQAQVCKPVGEHPVDANISAMLQNILRDLAKIQNPTTCSPSCSS